MQSQQDARSLHQDGKADVRVIAEERNLSSALGVEIKDGARNGAYGARRAGHISFCKDSIPDFTLQPTALQIHFPQPVQ